MDITCKTSSSVDHQCSIKQLKPVKLIIYDQYHGTVLSIYFFILCISCSGAIEK